MRLKLIGIRLMISGPHAFRVPGFTRWSAMLTPDRIPLVISALFYAYKKKECFSELCCTPRGIDFNGCLQLIQPW